MGLPKGERRGLTRRRTLQGIGAVLGTGLGCSSDSEPQPQGGDGSTSGDGSDGSSSTGLELDSSSGWVDGSGDGSSSSDGSSSDDGSSSGDTGEPVDECTSTSDLAPEELLAEIDTIVVVMMENRSFDHFFGSATFLERWMVDGLQGTETNPNFAGDPIEVFRLDNFEPVDPPHHWEDCHLQWNLGANDGFVRRHEIEHPESAHEVMGYHVRSQIPILYTLAESYTLCDRWFSSCLGPTWPNRFHLHAGTSNGQTSNLPELGITHIWDLLADAGLGARNYYSDLAWSWGGFVEPLSGYTSSIDEFFSAAAAGTLPSYVVIDPNFGILDGGVGNDDHPPHSLLLGQTFLASIYQALAESPQWNRCLLVITYDEHGGFYDHVSPPEAADTRREFQRLGFRVPGLVIGPHVRRGCVHSTTLDHVSVLSTVTRRHGLPALNTRVTQTNDVSGCINPAYLRDPQPPIALPQMVVSLSEALRPRPNAHGQPELRRMIERGELPMPKQHRRVDPGRALALRLLEHAERLGVAKLVD